MSAQATPLLVLSLLLQFRDKLALCLSERPDEAKIDILAGWERTFARCFELYCPDHSRDECRLFAATFCDGLDLRALEIERTLTTAREKRG